MAKRGEGADDLLVFTEVLVILPFSVNYEGIC